MLTEALIRSVGNVPYARSAVTAVLNRFEKTESVTPDDVVISRQVRYSRGSIVRGVSHRATVSIVNRQKERGWDVNIICPEPDLYLTFDTDEYGVVHVQMGGKEILSFGELTDSNTFDPDTEPVTVSVVSTTDDDTGGIIFIDGHGVYTWETDIPDPISLQYFSMSHWNSITDYDYRCGKAGVNMLKSADKRG